MKKFLILMFITLSLAVGAFASSEELLDPILFTGTPINPISVVEKDVYYTDSLEEENPIEIKFISTFKGWTAKTEFDVGLELGVDY
ncbi:MAG: hypothetical protein COA44_11520 [Arcobacter sp.]|nr:MAG: hypothetical protein COA44_11520 [Arcobacter sp.]